MTQTKERIDRGTGTGLGDPWRVIVLNDSHNTFQGVAFALSSVVPGVSYDDGMRLANRIHAAVYCPSWMPDPFDGVIRGRWNTIDSVSPDGSYLIGFIWQEVGSGELHVNLRGYPGRTRIPRCVDINTVGNVTRQSKIPCFADPNGHRRVAGIDATVYTANQDADRWHVLYAWRHDGSLYALSEHVVAPRRRCYRGCAPV